MRDFIAASPELWNEDIGEEGEVQPDCTIILLVHQFYRHFFL